MESERVLTCVFCGHAYPAGTAPAGDQILIDHINECPKHPLRAVREERDHYLKILVQVIRALDHLPLSHYAQLQMHMDVVHGVDAYKGSKWVNQVRESGEAEIPVGGSKLLEEHNRYREALVEIVGVSDPTTLRRVLEITTKDARLRPDREYYYLVAAKALLGES